MAKFIVFGPLDETDVAAIGFIHSGNGLGMETK